MYICLELHVVTCYRYLVGQYVTIHDNVISHVNITNVEAIDGGLYSCLAQNSMGFVAHSARLNIYGTESCIGVSYI
jgi:hypothetical protein